MGRHRSKREACDALNAAGLVAGPVANDEEVVADPHLAGRNMLVEHPRPDGVAQPVLIPGLPVKFADVAEGPETRVPWLGEHTDEVLGGELGLRRRGSRRTPGRRGDRSVVAVDSRHTLTDRTVPPHALRARRAARGRFRPTPEPLRGS